MIPLSFLNPMQMLSLNSSTPLPLVSQRILTLACLCPGEDEPLFNVVVAKACKYPICHIELVFEDDMSFSIFADTNLFFKPRTFSNPDYHLVSLLVSSMEYNSAYTFCLNAHKYDVKFSNLAMFASYCQPRNCPLLCTTPSVHAGSTFCSKIITEALQFAGVFEVEHLTPCTTTPSHLFEAVKDSSRRVLNSVPYKREMLKQIGSLALT